MKTTEHILRTIFLVIVLIGIGAPESFSQFNIIGKGSTEQLGRTESKKVKKEAKKLLKEIELKEKEVSDLLQRGAPTRYLEDFILTVLKYNAFCVKYGIEPYKSPLLGQIEITEPQTGSKPNEINTLTVSADDSAKDEAVKNASNHNDEITLTVTSDGSTKDEAIKNALRTAIEQAYGAFVSANTTILNDELVRDEIVTVSNGSIKEYNILSEYENPNGAGYGVTAKATVSLPHLITYAKSHGSECEFAGNTFAMEMRLFDLNKANERKAILNLKSQLRGLLPHFCNWRIEVKEPRIRNGESVMFDESYAKELATLKDGTINQGLFEKIKDMRYDNFYEVSANIYAIIPKNNIIGETLKKLSISDGECKSFEDRGLKLGAYPYEIQQEDGGYRPKNMKFRNEDIDRLMDSIHDMLADAYTNFVITDNLGNHHCLYNDEIRASANKENCVFGNFSREVGIYHGDNINVLRLLSGDEEILVVSLKEDDLFSYPVSINRIIDPDYAGHHYPYEILKGNYDTYHVFPPIPGTAYPLGSITFYIPRNEIGKYSSFKI